ncbi:preprotein translocase subunit YajC [Orenia marismortui]|uniref:Preprotein translocase subunit YajC n=1 Tax=Orenia marismortui TaxID=46469 RepID=A0A4R8GXM0_9FIRM|nr:preprotein translocase subunit YajC [Orenia marismortui]TDX51033.1 preprotein translocase subunit YajC [Orenia marismortui]
MQVLGSLLPFVVMILIFWLLIIKPQKKRQQERQSMLDSLEEGTKIVTIGGIKGTITNIADDELSLEIAPELEVKITRLAVGRVEMDEDEVTATDK